MELSDYAGLSTQRLDYIKNCETTKKKDYNEYSYTHHKDRLYEILHHSSENTEVDGLYGSNDNKRQFPDDVAGLESHVINELNMNNSKNKVKNVRHDNEIKDILQHNFENNFNKDASGYYLSDKGNWLTPRKSLTRHIDESEIGKYFSTKYAVIDKNSGKTEIMVQRKEGCSNIIVQNFSSFDAYATFSEEHKRPKRNDSVVHTKMGIIPREGAEIMETRKKKKGIFTPYLRRTNIAPENNWLCPVIDNDKKRPII